MIDSVLSRPRAELAYRITGDGPLLGYSHGVLLSRAVEDSLGLLDFGALGAGRRLLRYDARGHGRSTGRSEPADYTWPSLADDLLALADLAAADSHATDPAAGSHATNPAADPAAAGPHAAGPHAAGPHATGPHAAGPHAADPAAADPGVAGREEAGAGGARRGAGGPVDWAGASMGTGTLLWAATRRPERFRRLVLTIPPTTGATRGAAAQMYQTWAGTVEADGKAAWASGLARFGPPPIFATLDGFRIDADITEDLLPAVLRGAAVTDLPPAEAIAALPHPTLVLAWDTDPGHPVTSAEYLAATLPDATLHVSRTVDDVRTWPARIDEFLLS